MQVLKIWCEVRGGQTGPRSAWLKDDEGREREFADRRKAETEASRLTLLMNGGPGPARYRYTVREVDVPNRQPDICYCGAPRPCDHMDDLKLEFVRFVSRFKTSDETEEYDSPDALATLDELIASARQLLAPCSICGQELCNHDDAKCRSEYED